MIFSVSVTSLLLRPPSRHVPCSDSSLCANFPVCPLVLSAIPLLGVCYSCWSNLENVPNPLSVLLPQRNTKWIRQDYRLPLPPPLPSSSSSSSPSCHSLLSIPLAPVRALVASILRPSGHFSFSSAGLKPSPSLGDKLVPVPCPVTDALTGPSASWGIKCC